MDYKLLIDVTGWVGSIFVVIAYFSVSYDKFKISPFSYQLLNAAGSMCLVINTVYYHAFPSASVNVIWLVIALVALIRIRLSK